MNTVLRTRPVALTVAALALAALLAGCGRAGSPLKPSEAAVERAKEQNLPPPDVPVPNSQNPEKRFILDGLLE
ncbi:MAG: hypothetical protein ACR2O8_13100 [Rhizobiaceae bacterium]